MHCSLGSEYFWISEWHTAPSEVYTTHASPYSELVVKSSSDLAHLPSACASEHPKQLVANAAVSGSADAHACKDDNISPFLI